MGDMMGFSIFVILLIVALFVVISRWVFRINDIVARLDKIVLLLGGKAEPKTFRDGFKRGMEE